jgi:hypothetical protein
MSKSQTDVTTKGFSDDEIDLKQVGLKLITALQRNLRILLIAVLLGLGIGYWLYYRSPPIYETSLIASSKVLTYNKVQSLVDVLNKLALERNEKILSKKMNISIQLARCINQVKTFNINETKLQNNEGNEKEDLSGNEFKLIISIYDNTNVDSLQAGLIYYLENNEFVKKRNSIQKHNLGIMLRRVKEEEKKLDSLRFSINKLLESNAENSTSILMADPASINKDIIALYERELNIQAELLLIDDIQVIQSFTRFSRVTSPNLIKDIGVSLGSAITLAFFIMIILETRRGIRILKYNLEKQ